MNTLKSLFLVSLISIYSNEAAVCGGDDDRDRSSVLSKAPSLAGSAVGAAIGGVLSSVPIPKVTLLGRPGKARWLVGESGESGVIRGGDAGWGFLKAGSPGKGLLANGAESTSGLQDLSQTRVAKVAMNIGYYSVVAPVYYGAVVPANYMFVKPVQYVAGMLSGSNSN